MDNLEIIPPLVIPSADHGDTIGDATVIRPGATIDAAIEHESDRDFFTFLGHGGRSYRIQVVLGSLDAIHWEFSGPGGCPIGERDAQKAKTGPMSETTWTVDRVRNGVYVPQGRYMIQIGEFSDNATGTYQLSLDLTGPVELSAEERQALPPFAR